MIGNPTATWWDFVPRNSNKAVFPNTTIATTMKSSAKTMALFAILFEPLFGAILAIYDSASVWMQDLAGHVRRVVRCEEYIAARNFFRLSRPTERNI